MSTESTTTAATKIVIVSGQEFSVPADLDNEVIRQQLVTQGFADAASAKIEQGTREVGGVIYVTIEFVKRAGTKGLDGAGLAALLATVPATRAANLRGGPLVVRLLSGTLTFAEALAAEEQLDAALQSINCTATLGGHLCSQLDALDATPADLLGW